jgi:uncharacterized membrane protein YjjP (DUF1212 family)/uncharacterized membrane protein YjjB (DUF3815 family)
METQTRADPELDSTELLLDLAAALHGAYLPADELERRIREVARGLHVDGEIFTSQTLAVVDLQGSPGARLRRIAFSPHWNLSRLHALVDLCDGIAAGRIGLAAARPELDRIASAPRRYRHALVVAASAVYAAAVAARVGGGGSEMLAAGFIGIVAGVIQFGGLRFPSLDLQKSFLATFAGTLAAVTLGQSLLPFNAERAIFGAMTLLIPAMVVTIGAHEVATEESVEAGFVRLAYGLLRFLMLALGTVAAAKLWLLFGGLPAPVPAHGLPTAAVVAILVPGGLALVVVVQGRARDAGWMVAAVLVAWGAEKLTKEAFGSDGSPFLATFALGVFAYVQARLPGHLPATVIFPGLMQIAPGFLGAETVVALLRPSAADAGKTFLHVLLVALQIVTGLMAASLAQGSVARRATAT